MILQYNLVKWQSFKRESIIREKLVREQDGRLHASPSSLGRICCKRERSDATEPVRLNREDCSLLPNDSSESRIRICVAPQQAVESGTRETSGVANLFDKHAAGISDDHATFLKKYLKLLSWESGGQIERRAEMWTLPGISCSPWNYIWLSSSCFILKIIKYTCPLLWAVQAVWI